MNNCQDSATSKIENIAQQLKQYNTSHSFFLNY